MSRFSETYYNRDHLTNLELPKRIMWEIGKWIHSEIMKQNLPSMVVNNSFKELFTLESSGERFQTAIGSQISNKSH